jgi:hypothetical protein
MDQSYPVRLTAPEAELSTLSFCDADPIALADWVGSLPMANTADTATQIRQATFEIARLTVDYPLRMELLESLRPTLHYLCTRLDQSATSNSNHGDAIARLAQRLQTNLCSGYKAVILAALPAAGERKVLETISLAIHRALADLSRTLLRTLQFYVAPADRLWLELNQLYLLAERLGVDDHKWVDQENHSRTETTVRDAYLRSILLALSKPNQLRHRQLTMVFNALELWAPFASLSGPDGKALFCVDLGSEHGPQYDRLMDNPVEPRCINTDQLVWELDASVKDIPGEITMPERFPVDLARHLADAWGVMRARAFKRARSESSIKVCVGIRAAHYFLSGAVDFADQLDPGDSELRQEVNPFLKEDPMVISAGNPSEVKDVWDDAFDLRVRIPVNPNIKDPESLLLSPKPLRPAREAPPKDVRGSYRFYDTISMDTSPGGYRIRWNEPLPSSLQAGEMVAVREEHDPRWCVAVVRWIRQDAEGTSMGVELLSPRAIPVALRVINKKGGPGEYARAFLLPALDPIGQPATLVTAPVPFQPGQKIRILRQGVQTTAQLGQCTLKTESFNQFTFRLLGGYLENNQADLNMIV